MNRETGGWLEGVMVRAQEAGWCTTPFCTTCGCMEFRRACWAGAARQAGVKGLFESARLPRDVSPSERQLLLEALVAGLRELPPRWAESTEKPCSLRDTGLPDRR